MLSPLLALFNWGFQLGAKIVQQIVDRGSSIVGGCQKLLEKLPACGRCQKLLKRCEPCATRCNCSKVTNLLTAKAQFKVSNIRNVVVANVVRSLVTLSS